MMLPNDYAGFIHDDRTWCDEERCPNLACSRNQKNMMIRTGMHSFARFRGTGECPLREMSDEVAEEYNDEIFED